MKSLALRYWCGLSPALRHYYRASTWPSVLFLILMGANAWSGTRTGLAAPARAVFALAPVLALAWLFVAYLRFLRTCDELEQRIELHALAWAAGITMQGMVACVLLLDARLIQWSAVHTGAALALLLFGSYGLIRGLLHRRYQ